MSAVDPGCCSASKPTSRFRTISPRIRWSPRWRRRDPTVTEQWDYVGDRAWPRRLCRRSLAALCDRRAGLGGRALPQRRLRTATMKRSPAIPGSAGPPAPASNMPSRRTGARGWNISTVEFGKADIGFPLGHAVYIDAGFPVAQPRPQSARSTGRARGGFTPKTSLARSGIRSLGNPRPDDVPAAGLSRVPRALYGPQQPDAGGAASARPGATACSSTRGCGRAARSITTPNCCRDLD